MMVLAVAVCVLDIFVIRKSPRGTKQGECDPSDPRLSSSRLLHGLELAINLYKRYISGIFLSPCTLLTALASPPFRIRFAMRA